MATDRFTDPESPHEDWVDVRMTDPEEGEWDVDVVIVDGRVKYVDLRIRPDRLTAFIECLIDDVGSQQASTILSNVADREEIDLQDESVDEETTG